MSRQSSAMDLQAMAPPPLRIHTGLSRTATLRSSVASAFQRSGVGSLRGRNRPLRQRAYTAPTLASSLETSQRPLTPIRTSTGYSPIVIEGYGNGLEPEKENQEPDSCDSHEHTPPHTIQERLGSFDLALNEAAVEPIMEEDKLDAMLQVGQNALITDLHRNDSDASYSATSTNTTKLSPIFDSEDQDEQVDTDGSSIHDYDDDAENDPTKHDERAAEDEYYYRNAMMLAEEPEESSDEDIVIEHSSSDLPADVLGFEVPRPASYRPTSIALENEVSPIFRTSRVSLNAGCYAPSNGVVTPPPTRLPSGMQQSTEFRYSDKASSGKGHTRNFSHASVASSVYPEPGESGQAADIAEEETRGRRRSRALDQLRNTSRFNFTDG